MWMGDIWLGVDLTASRFDHQPWISYTMNDGLPNL